MKNSLHVWPLFIANGVAIAHLSKRKPSASERVSNTPLHNCFTRVCSKGNTTCLDRSRVNTHYLPSATSHIATWHIWVNEIPLCPKGTLLGPDMTHWSNLVFKFWLCIKRSPQVLTLRQDGTYSGPYGLNWYMFPPCSLCEFGRALHPFGQYVFIF